LAWTIGMPRSEYTAAKEPAALRAPLIIVDNFLAEPLALAMRQDIEAHFANPGAHRADTHQVWNYWFIPELYTYLRTAPEKVIGRNVADAFHDALSDWSITNLGMADISWPYLSLYVDGCRQSLHNDSLNGRFAYVYSLTRDQRRTIGGETLVLREGDPFRGNLARASAGRSFYDAVEPKFNRLVVFDDRLPHGVERVEGSMDPVEGRFVLHGHLSESGAVVEGPLSNDAVAGPTREILAGLGEDLSAEAALYHGPLVLRLTIAADGTVSRCEVIADRVMHPDPGHVDWEPLCAKLVDRFRALKFLPADGTTILTQPVIFGGSLSRAG